MMPSDHLTQPEVPMSEIQSSHTEAFLLIDVPAKKSGDVTKRLISEYRQYVAEAHGIWGESDVIARVSVPNHAVLANLVMQKIQHMTFVRGTRTYITIEGMSHRNQPSKKDGGIDGFVFINVDAARSDEIAQMLITQYKDNIKEAHAVWGAADVIARISVSSMSELTELVIKSIQATQYVSVTRTYLFIPGMSEFSRELKQVCKMVPAIQESMS
jgi:DNA-binding Lrp family transcriptional regulator